MLDADGNPLPTKLPTKTQGSKSVESGSGALPHLLATALSTWPAQVSAPLPHRTALTPHSSKRRQPGGVRGGTLATWAAAASSSSGGAAEPGQPGAAAWKVPAYILLWCDCGAAAAASHMLPPLHAGLPGRLVIQWCSYQASDRTASPVCMHACMHA